MALLDGKLAVITGGSRGIGKAIALKFASEGADIAFTYVNKATDVEAIISEFATYKVKVKGYAVDASSFDAAHEVVTQIYDEWGHIDILVNNAGITRDTLLLRMTEEQWDQVVATNLKSAFNYIHALTPVFFKQRSGNIINISSVVGVSGNPGQCNYAASKAGMIALAKSAAKELGSRGIRANSITPGFIMTDMTKEIPEQKQKDFVATIPLRRPGNAEEVAKVALFLASDLSSYVSGQVISCCGGMI